MARKRKALFVSSAIGLGHVQRDLAMPTDRRDPASCQSYFQAMTQLATLLDLQGVKVGSR